MLSTAEQVNNALATKKDAYKKHKAKQSMKGMQGVKIPTRVSQATCPKHPGTHLVYYGKLKPFCPKCQAEKMAREHDQLVSQFERDHIKGMLKRDSLVDDPVELSYTFDKFEASKGTREWAVKQQARQIAGRYYKDRHVQFNTLLYGTPGEGKTMLSMAILNAVNDYSNPPQRCLFVNVNSLFLAIRHSFDDPTSIWTEDYAVRLLSSADLLVIDDLGSESAMTSDRQASQFVQRVLYQVTNRQKRIITTTNLTLKQLETAYNPKLVSRLRAGSKGSTIDFSGISDKRY